MFWSEDAGIVFRSEYPDDKFLWTLPNCFANTYSYGEYKPRTNSILCSPWFSSYNTKWRLTLMYRRPRRQYSPEFIGLFLWKMPSSGLSPKLKVKLGLFNTNTPGSTKEFEGELNSHGCFGKYDFMQLSEFDKDAEVIFADGCLRFFCEMRLTTEILKEIPLECDNEKRKHIPEDNVTKEISEYKGVDKLVHDFKNLLLNGQQSDFTVKVEDRVFNLHRNVLIVRSPVFASMLTHDTKENDTGEVNIPDCTAEAFDLFLSHVYTGTAGKISTDNVFDLYYLADKYQISDLKQDCVECMEKNLSIENFCSVMTLSLLHNESGLQRKATSFFCDNVKLIIKTVPWQNYVKNYPIQANELYIKAMNA